MIKVDAEAMQLAYDPLILTKENCPLPPKLVGDASFTIDTDPKVLTALPAVLVVGHGVFLPEDSWDDIMKALMTTERQNSITGGKEQKGISLAYVTLLVNYFQSYLWTEADPIGVKTPPCRRTFAIKG